MSASRGSGGFAGEQLSLPLPSVDELPIRWQVEARVVGAGWVADGSPFRFRADAEARANVRRRLAGETVLVRPVRHV